MLLPIFLIDSSSSSVGSSSVGSDDTMSENCEGADAAFVSSLDQAIQEGNRLVQEGEDVLKAVMDDEETAHNKKQKISQD
jgi:hypothetical protein